MSVDRSGGDAAVVDSQATKSEQMLTAAATPTAAILRMARVGIEGP
jgi:hypothetical protein